MGNLSCSQRRGSSTRAAKATPHAQEQVARVLQVDGGVLRYAQPVKVITLLLEYPNHVVCALESMRPGHHSLPSLLPHEELRLGRLYLLLPFRALSAPRKSSPHAGDSGARDRAAISRAPLGTSALHAAAAAAQERPPGHHRRTSSLHRAQEPPANPPSRLCDTPELQRAYRSAMLRRCRSWTPRLQAINEGMSRRPAL